jgi:hypothetical protein
MKSLKCNNKLIKGLVLVFLISVTSHFAYASKVKLAGKVLDNETNSPLEFVNVAILGQPIGVITNELGEFEMYISNKYVNSKLIISSMAYIADTLIISPNLGYITVRLTPAKFLIPDVVVRPVQPLDILRQAIKNIPLNYSPSRTFLDAYYREIVKLDTNFIKYADAACIISYSGYQEPYDMKAAEKDFFNTGGLNILSIPLPFPQGPFVVPHPKDTARVYETRRSDNLESFQKVPGLRENFNRFNIGGGPLHVTSADMVKNSGGILDTNTWKYYDFKYKGKIEKPNATNYIISFQPKKTKKGIIWQGTIYIEVKNKAIVQIDMFPAEKSSKYLRNSSLEYIVEPSLLNRKLHGSGVVARKTEHVDQNVSVSYALADSIYHVKKIEIENTFLNSGDIFPDYVYKAYLLLHVNAAKQTRVLPGIPPFKTNRYNYLFTFQKEYNKEFWESYPTPKLTGTLYGVIKDLEKNRGLEEQFKKH